MLTHVREFGAHHVPSAVAISSVVARPASLLRRMRGLVRGMESCGIPEVRGGGGEAGCGGSYKVGTYEPATVLGALEHTRDRGVSASGVAGQRGASAARTTAAMRPGRNTRMAGVWGAFS